MRPPSTTLSLTNTNLVMILMICDFISYFMSNIGQNISKQSIVTPQVFYIDEIQVFFGEYFLQFFKQIWLILYWYAILFKMHLKILPGRWQPFSVLALILIIKWPQHFYGWSSHEYTRSSYRQFIRGGHRVDYWWYCRSMTVSSLRVNLKKRDLIFQTF